MLRTAVCVSGGSSQSLHQPVEIADLFADDFHAAIFDEINADWIRRVFRSAEMLVGLSHQERYNAFFASRQTCVAD